MFISKEIWSRYEANTKQCRRNVEGGGVENYTLTKA